MAADAERERKARPRAPSRGRGVERYEALLDAVDALLRDHTTDDIGLYQIAEHAKAPPASVYHFFPTKEAAFLGLAERHLDGFRALGRMPVGHRALQSWQSLVAWDLNLSVEYYRAHPPAMQLFLGRYGGLATRQANNDFNVKIARNAYRRLNAAFHMPMIRDAEQIFHVNIEIIDAILALSYSSHGEITDALHAQALRASLAYCRTYLPEHVALLSQHAEAITRGEPVVLRSSSATPAAAGDLAGGPVTVVAMPEKASCSPKRAKATAAVGN